MIVRSELPGAAGSIEVERSAFAQPLEASIVEAVEHDFQVAVLDPERAARLAGRSAGTRPSVEAPQGWG